MTHGFLKGMAAGAVMGIGAYMVMNPMSEKDKKKIAKSTTKVFTAMGNVADNLVDMYKNKMD
ncbi:MAG: YtxH domain-containing protein [Clostridia bacterium]|nr:YtxH domain-containing protein [Clostridia bacterium]MBQ9997478.1 YtxH domain-containing protein [Clostridia bacterium]